MTYAHQDSQSTVAQSRVRRLIGRRRAGLDRYIGALSREMGQDSIDPIADMLTQLTGKGVLSLGLPPHIPTYLQIYFILVLLVGLYVLLSGMIFFPQCFS